MKIGCLRLLTTNRKGIGVQSGPVCGKIVLEGVLTESVAEYLSLAGIYENVLLNQNVEK